MENQILGLLDNYLSRIMATSVLRCGMAKTRVNPNRLRRGEALRLFRGMERGIHLYVRDKTHQRECLTRLSRLLEIDQVEQRADNGTTRIEINDEYGILEARHAVKLLCEEMGFSVVVTIKLMTVVSELSRNIVQYAGTGEIVVTKLFLGRAGLRITASDKGPGIANLEQILKGEYRSKQGLGRGILGSKKIMDEFHIQTDPDKGTTIHCTKYIDHR